MTRRTIPLPVSSVTRLAALIVPAVGLGAVPPALAQDDPIETIVVTGSRVTDLLADIPNSTTVIGLDRIEAQNHANVLDILREVPGLQVTQPGGRGGIASVFIRGGEPNFTMVLIDGIRVNDPNNTRGGSFDFSTLNVEDIERIEIVRGPQSAIYGSDALSGVINIITKGPAEELGTTLHAEAGEDDYRRAAIEVAGPTTETGGFALRLGHVDDDGATPGNRYESNSVNAKFSFGDGRAWDLRFFGRYSDNEGTSFPEDSGGPELAVIRDLDEKSSEDLSIGVAGGIDIADGWRLNATANRYDHQDSYVSPGIAPGVRDGVPPNGADSELERTSYSAHVVGNLTDSLRATLGVDHYREDGESEGFVEFAPGFSIPAGFTIDREVTGYFGEFRYQPVAALTLLGSLRHDEPDEEAGETTTKLGALYDLAGGRTTFRVNWGEGFKLPSFFALASPLVGNPDLKSEKSESFDIGVTQRFFAGRLATTVTLYRNKFKDLIDFDPALFTNVNRSEVEAQGVELEVDYRVSDTLDVYAEAVYLDLEVKDADRELLQRPDWRGSVSVRWRPAATWLLQSSWLYVGETFDSSVPTGQVVLDGYNRFDTTLTWRAADSTDLVFAVDNLFDADYEEAVGFPSPGRRGRLALRYRF
ncbi:TonB-dependent receptor plug domain-containing protein [Lentisalinibacter salinarum]|uniref:TonB-dependent receptor plug domain-containing protein n=1 Tax=Lentisalinibacter salinarum TaxID=2992239 RepID=UPI003864394A